MEGSGTSLSHFELKNGGLRNELDPFLAWKWDSPELPGRVWLTRGAAFGLSRPWEAMNGLKLKKFWKWWSPERQNPPKNVKWWCSGTDFGEICENDVLWNRNSGLKMGVSLAAHTQYAYIWKYPPPPPRGHIVFVEYSYIVFRKELRPIKDVKHVIFFNLSFSLYVMKQSKLEKFSIFYFFIS